MSKPEMQEKAQIQRAFKVLEGYGDRAYHNDACCHQCSDRIFYGKHISFAQPYGGVRK